jgi:hypothetical protein
MLGVRARAVRRRGSGALMSVHPNDAAILRRLISITLAITSRPALAPVMLPDLFEVGDDIAAAMRCPSPGRHIGTVEIALGVILTRLASEHIKTMGEVLILADAARRLLPIVREHRFEAAGGEHARD